jgi:hypothetical protein
MLLAYYKGMQIQSTTAHDRQCSRKAASLIRPPSPAPAFLASLKPASPGRQENAIDDETKSFLTVNSIGI